MNSSSIVLFRSSVELKLLLYNCIWVIYCSTTKTNGRRRFVLYKMQHHPLADHTIQFCESEL